MVAKSNSGLIADNVREQLSKGIAGDERVVGIYASLRYANLKAGISQAPFGVVDLRLSGNLYANINTKFSGNQVTTDSNVDYSKYQIGRYGDRIYENTPENKEKVRDKNSRDSVRAYSKALGL
ncbi:MAG: hypothetical protein V3U16_05805 [Candidatus Neomarinimicrobiota bacterium]